MLVPVVFLPSSPTPSIAPPKIGIPNPATDQYATAIRKAGGTPIILPYEIESIDHWVTELDGLLLTGGNDIDPAIYGEKQHETTVLVAPNRYAFESQLAKKWLEQTDKPLLGICLGCQLINVIQGGSLIQDIPSEFDANHRKGHSIDIETNSKLYQLVETRRLEINSNHHQAVRNLGDQLIASARADDGIIEAIEMPDKPFVVGVQWHPERMSDDKFQTKLFTEFVTAAKRNSP